MVTTSQNGWPVINSSGKLREFPYITGRVYPSVYRIFRYLCEEFDARVEDIDAAQSWGWAVRDIRGSDQVSNHASGTAIDLNATKHPLGAEGTFDAAQIAEIRKILTELEGTVRWGGDYRGRKDEMHFEIDASDVKARQVASKIGGPEVAMVSPMRGRFTSGYDLNRYISGLGRSPHAGVDIAPPTAGTVGSPVYAAFAGTVRKVVKNVRHGNKSSTWAPGRTGSGILVSNPDGEGNGYNHVNAVVKVGQKVKAGQLIGYTDRSGTQTGPHLHFEMWSDWRNPNSHYNPAIVFNKYGVKIGSKPKGTSGGGSGGGGTKSRNSLGGLSKAQIRAVQGHMNRFGFGKLAVDGVARDGGPTAKAVRAFKKAWGLPVDSVWGMGATNKRKALEEKYRKKPNLSNNGTWSRAAITAEQWALKDAGFYAGRIDGKEGPMQRRARKRWLKARGFNDADLKVGTAPFGRAAVRCLQRFLVSVGELPSAAYVDGDHGPVTRAAHKRALEKGKVK